MIAFYYSSTIIRNRLRKRKKVAFVVIDLETANGDIFSICQIGAVKYVDGMIAEEFMLYVNPEDYFSDFNISIHGITEEMVSTASIFPDLFSSLLEFVEKNVVITHTHFDRIAIQQVTKKYQIPTPDWVWLDSAKIVRRTWPQFASKGYGLSNICSFLDINFQHHDALEDAKAAGQVVLCAVEKSGISIKDWGTKIHQPISPATNAPINRAGNPNGLLFGEIIVFTGALQMPRREAADIAASLGCKVVNVVTTKTTILVLGDQDLTKLAGKTKSSKHLKAESLAESTNIKILRETDFLELARLSFN